MKAITRRQCLAQLSGCALGASAATAFGSTGAGEKEPKPSWVKRGREKKAFTDPDGRTIWQLTDNRLESKHTYYDISPWNADGRYIVFSSADPADLTTAHHDGLSTSNCQVCIMDTKTWEITVIARGGFYTAHNGTFPLWHPIRNVVYFMRSPEEIGIVDIDTREQRAMKGVLRQLSPDGKTFASQLNHYDRPDEPDAWGIYTMNEDGSDRKRILSIKQLYDITPNRDQFDLSDMTVGNTKWTPDNRHMLIAMWVQSKPHVRRSIYVASADGSQVRWLTHFGHHHSWAPDGKAVLFNGYKTITPDGEQRDPRMFLIDFDGSNRRVVIDEPVGSHPLMDPSGQMIADFDGKGIFVTHIKEQRIERVATYRKPFDISHRGTHPHCVWNRDGSQIIYNSAETGHSELYLTQMKR